MKILTVFCAFSFAAGLCVVADAPSSAAPPPGHFTAKCASGYTADPSWYTGTQLNSSLGFKYKCFRKVPLNTSNWFHPGFPYVCSDKFTAIEGSGPDAPNVVNIKVDAEGRYFCLSAGH